MSKIRYNNQNKKLITIIIIIIIKIKDKSYCRYLSLQEKKAGYIIPVMNCYPRNGQLRDTDFTPHTLYHPKQQQYSQHPILWVVLNISTIVLRTRLIRKLSQHPIKQVGLTIHFKTSLVRNSDNIKYKTQKPCNENPSLKSTDLRQAQEVR